MNVRLTKEQKKKVANSKELFRIMHSILHRENMIGRSREHFWVVSLDASSKIINIELVGLGSQFRAVITPSDVFSIAFQKRAAYTILAHNHPSGTLKPSSADIELTKKLYHVGKYHSCPIYDHLIITDKSYYSMRDKGLIKEIDKEPNPLHFIEDYFNMLKTEREIERKKSLEIAKNMLLAGVEEKVVAITTGLSVEEVRELK
jgi:DNA repair protein RadC